MSKDIVAVALETSLSNQTIAEMMVGMNRYVREHNQGFVFTLSGFDDDPRELFDIPEAAQFLHRIMGLGFFSLLEVTTSMEGLAQQFAGLPSPGLGAFEGWMIATNQFPQMTDLTDMILHGEISRKLFLEFFDWLKNVSNPKCEDIVRETSKKEVQDLQGAVFALKDGQVQITETSLSEFGDSKKAPCGFQRIDPLYPLKRKSWFK